MPSRQSRPHPHPAGLEARPCAPKAPVLWPREPAGGALGACWGSPEARRAQLPLSFHAPRAVPRPHTPAPSPMLTAPSALAASLPRPCALPGRARGQAVPSPLTPGLARRRVTSSPTRTDHKVTPRPRTSLVGRPHPHRLAWHLSSTKTCSPARTPRPVSPGRAPAAHGPPRLPAEPPVSAGTALGSRPGPQTRAEGGTAVAPDPSGSDSEEGG